jgi:CelD/BcsL family acetyltransferase involved in cellulose biosynthesis
MSRGSAPSGAIEVQLTRCPELAALAADWLALEANSDASFFTSWSWIGSWLASLPPDKTPELLSARSNGELVGLALLGRQRARRHCFVNSRGLHLNASGDPVADAIAIEYNGFLVRRDNSTPVQQAMLDHIVSAEADWDEFYLPGLTSAPVGIELAPGTSYRVEHKPVYLVDLERVREKSGDYLAVLSQQSRYQVRKSEKACAKLGSITLDAASDLRQALSYLDSLKALHQPYWIARGQPGAFASEFSNRFHHQLVSRAWGRGEIQLLSVSLGDKVLGYIYNFVHRGHVYNYQTGIDYSLLEGSVSPGLVCHARAISHCAAQGLELYDFMAGEQRYKRAMSTCSSQLGWGVLQRDRLRFRAEDALRRVRRRIDTYKGSRNAAAATAAA